MQILGPHATMRTRIRRIVLPQEKRIRFVSKKISNQARLGWKIIRGSKNIHRWYSDLTPAFFN